MAEMNSDSGEGHAKHQRVRRSKKLSTRVDMTPMVDLGFLLITFFIFTTTMIKPASMEVEKPPSRTDFNPMPKSRTMTIMMGKNNMVFWYMGINDPDKNEIPRVNITDYSQYGLPKTLREKDSVARNATGYHDRKNHDYARNGINVIIKPLDNSSYKNVVDVLDEMKVNDIKTFAWAEAAPVDIELLEKIGLNK
jgi:biopolymer transport protein ExbD